MKTLITLFFTLFFSHLTASAVPAENQEVLQRLQERMNANVQALLLKEDEGAKLNNRENIKDLLQLQDQWMPLPDRLKKAIERQKQITQTIADTEDKQYKKPLEQQTTNLTQTNRASRQLEELKQSPQKPKNTDEVKKALTAAERMEKRTLERLQKNKQIEALDSSGKAQTLLERALTLLQKNQKNKQDKQTDSKDNQQNSQPQSSPRANKNQSNQDQQEANQQDQRKMTEEEARQELARLQQEAEKRMKERKKALGKIQKRPQQNAEKNW